MKGSNPQQGFLLVKIIHMSLENAERFLKDARLLINDSSFGHAFALAVNAATTIALFLFQSYEKTKGNENKNFT